MTEIVSNLTDLRARLDSAALIAVSKTRTVAEIRQALDAGQRVFAENKVQEAETKFSVLRRDYPDIELHLIGRLQTNKALRAVQVFDVIQTVDREPLAVALSAAIQRAGRHPNLYIEVNIACEPQKAGVAPEKLPEFLDFCRRRCNLSITGLMCLPPVGENPQPFFQAMRNMQLALRLRHLSMGMSADFEIAQETGATQVRLGTAVFGPRLSV